MYNCIKINIAYHTEFLSQLIKSFTLSYENVKNLVSFANLQEK